MPKPRKQYSIHHPQCHIQIIPIRLLGHRFLGDYEYETKESHYPETKITSPFSNLMEFGTQWFCIPFPTPPRRKQMLRMKSSLLLQGLLPDTEKKLKIIHTYHNL